MVIRLGKYLRIIGYDAEWDIGLRTHDLIQKANAANRIFVTRNTHITEQFPPVLHLMFLTDTEPVRQFDKLVHDLDLDVHSHLFCRCIRCNVELLLVADKRDIETRIHPNVYSKQEQFFQCPHCGTVFWHGSHVTNTCRKLGLPSPRSTFTGKGTT